MAKKHENADGTLRSLSNRHVQMIAIGGTIGTGLFLGAGSTISATGPSVILIYALMGVLLSSSCCGHWEKCFTQTPTTIPSFRTSPKILEKTREKS
ncbi:MAG: hypothetical protein V8S74_08060 [Lachnospirales bacterium]